ncbi:MAG: hypothetical protein IPM38_13840 [Ignavibacteria bacterium]|nr:hypothetical protein [Ignavibacteria bacterium]
MEAVPDQAKNTVLSPDGDDQEIKMRSSQGKDEYVTFKVSKGIDRCSEISGNTLEKKPAPRVIYTVEMR